MIGIGIKTAEPAELMLVLEEMVGRRWAVITAVTYLEARLEKPEEQLKEAKGDFAEKWNNSEKCLKCAKRDACALDHSERTKNEMLAAVEFNKAINKYLTALGIDAEDEDNGSKSEE